MKNKKAFTLVELLAVIVILAVILVIAVPQVLDVITSTKQGSIDVSVKNIAKAAEMKYTEMIVTGENISGTINCSEVINISNTDYSNCNVIFDNEGKAMVTLTGIGKFEGYVCTSGTKENSNCVNINEEKILINYINYLYVIKPNENGLVKDDTDDQNIRYAGSNEVVKNYVSFDGDVWRIIGIVDGKVKLVKEESIGSYSWDSSPSNYNSGYGYNIWETKEGQTKEDGTTKADLNVLLNEGYYGGNYPSQCYVGRKNATTECPTTYINPTLKTMVDENAIWYLGGQAMTTDISSKKMYEYERSNLIYNTNISKIKWNGPIGLILASDYGYAVDKNQCNEPLFSYNNVKCLENNWLFDGFLNWTMTPGMVSASNVFFIDSEGRVHYSSNSFSAIAIRPSVYLKSNILIENGDGSISNPYILSII